MKKDGFTLIEILLVLVILVTVSVAGTFAIQNIQKKSNEERLRELYKEIESATDVYLSENDAFLKDILNKEVDEKCIRIYTLQNEGLLSPTLTNPVTNKLIPANLCVMVYMKSDGTVSSSFNESDEKKIITLNVVNGTSDKSTKSGYNKVVFNVTPNEGYRFQLIKNTCNGTLNGSEFTITDITNDMECSISFQVDVPTLYEQLLADKTNITTKSDNSTVTIQDNTNTLYTSTENGTTVYYFVGNALDNWVKFGKKSSRTDLYWRIIRTNSDGSIRLLYHSTSPTSQDAYIGTSDYNTEKSDSMYVGYMYGTSGTLESNRTNTNSSAIKKTIDKWYEDYLKINYGKYLSETAVYCNDRSIYDGTYTATGSNSFNYSGFTRQQDLTPSYDCENNGDKFTVSTSTGNGSLSYPIGLMTSDELLFAFQNGSMGTGYFYYNSNKKSSTETNGWFTMTPRYWSGTNAVQNYVHVTDSTASIQSVYTSGYYWVRPVISLKSCVIYASGDGTADNPYTIDESYEC